MEIWKPPVELSEAEKFVVESRKKRRVFVFLRELRHRIFDEPLQQKLIAAYSSVERGKSRVPPAQLGLLGALLVFAQRRRPLSAVEDDAAHCSGPVAELR